MDSDYSRSSQPIYFDALFPSVAALAFGAAMVGIGAALGIDGIRFGGTILCLVCGVVSFLEGVAVSHRHITALNCERKAVGLPLIGKDAVIIAELERRQWEQAQAQIAPEPAQLVQVNTYTQIAPNQVRLASATYPNPPSDLFLQLVYKSKSDNNRIPSEESLIKLGKDNGSWNSNQAKIWLGILDEQGVTEPGYVSETGNAWRRIKFGLTLDSILSKFGYATTAPPP